MMIQGINVYLIGMMGAGKTTVGQLLAQKLKYVFFDSDALIVKAAGKSINEIFATSGESEFRQLESQVLSELSSYKKLVVATGGGIVLQRMNWSYLHHGIVVWLDVPVELLWHRLQDDQTRPLLKDPDPLGKLESILAQREHLYDQADLRVTITENQEPLEIVNRIINGFSNIVKDGSDNRSDLTKNGN